MLQGREINPLFLSPAPGIEPGSAGVRRRRFTHLPRRPHVATVDHRMRTQKEGNYKSKSKMSAAVEKKVFLFSTCISVYDVQFVLTFTMNEL